MASRKIIQISGATYDSDQDMGVVFALCDDGTVWINDANGWDQLKPIPQGNAGSNPPPDQL